MPENKIYQITLTPLGPFFFGGEIVFGGGENAQDERRRSYLVHSRLLPQQTSLLGMLREELLRTNQLLRPWNDDAQRTKVEKEADALQLVGQTGFQVQQQPLPEGQLPGYGIIRRLSPVVLCDEQEELYQPSPVDDHKMEDRHGILQALQWERAESADSPLHLKYYQEKEGLSLCFAPLKASVEPRPLEQFFQQQDQVGITVTNRKNWRENDGDEEGFFRRSSYRNGDAVFTKRTNNSDSVKESNQPFSFRFWVEAIPQEGRRMWEDSIVHLGGERSAFKMQVEERTDLSQAEDALFSMPVRYNTQAPWGYTRLLLRSDTYLPVDKLTELGVFVAARTQAFRFFSTDLVNTQNFYAFAQRHEQRRDNHHIFQFGTDKKHLRGRQQSKKYTLLQRGGVLLVPEANAFALETAILERTDFRQIGYNNYQTL